MTSEELEKLAEEEGLGKLPCVVCGKETEKGGWYHIDYGESVWVCSPECAQIINDNWRLFIRKYYDKPKRRGNPKYGVPDTFLEFLKEKKPNRLKAWLTERLLDYEEWVAWKGRYYPSRWFKALKTIFEIVILVVTFIFCFLIMSQIHLLPVIVGFLLFGLTIILYLVIFYFTNNVK